MFILVLKPENRWMFGNYAGRKSDGKIYFTDYAGAKRFQSEEEAKEWAGASFDQFEIENT